MIRTKVITAMELKRRSLNLSQVTIARIASIVGPKISSIERGDIPCRKDEAERIARALRCNLGDIFSRIAGGRYQVIDLKKFLPAFFTGEESS